MLVSIQSETSQQLLDQLLELQLTFDYKFISINLGGIKSIIVIDYFGDGLSYRRFVLRVKDYQDSMISISKLGNPSSGYSNKRKCLSADFEAHTEQQVQDLLDIIGSLKSYCEHVLFNNKCSGKYNVNFYLKDNDDIQPFHKVLVATLDKYSIKLSQQFIRKN